jgi:hypothetical protein
MSVRYEPAANCLGKFELPVHPLLVNWNRELVDGLDLAFNESTACGLTFDAEAAEARLLIEVLALPEAGPLDRDSRRVAVFSGVSAVEVILRPEMDSDLGPVLPLESMDALETFFASLGQADAMYGWSFFDIDDPGADWNQPPSLLLHVPTANPSPHTVHWFTECGRPTAADGWERFFLQGVLRFKDLRIERADLRALPLEAFIADAKRWWDAFAQHDARLSSEAQQQAQAASSAWRGWGGSSVMVPGSGS